MKYDFKNDWKAHVSDELLLQGFKYDDSKDLTDNSIILFNINRRLPMQTPRKVIFSSEFYCPDENRRGLDHLVKKIEAGDCLTPNLSKTISRADYNDAALDGWGIHHFHLGGKQINGVVERTKNVVFVFILADCALFIQILAHGKGYPDLWVNTSLLEIIHNNWPDTISHMKTTLSGTKLSASERTNLRRCNTNVNIEVSDGTVYFSPGGGRMINGDSITDFMSLQLIYRDLEYLEAIVAQTADQIKQKIITPNGDLHFRVDFSDIKKLRVIEVNSKTVLNFQ
ncbi:hypothetical protein V6257_10545 [Pseudoalteromonas issachenkonii]|uniref:Uncharacterized protein n=1 Tax=Pseudoalteromonas issachenkonii TaxID=152297 RepID=A0ABU9H0T2_9GAMM